MKKVEYQFGLISLMIVLLFFSCPNPTNDTFLPDSGKDNEDETEIIEVDDIDNPDITDIDDKDNEPGNDKNHDYPEIIDFSFNVNQTVIRSSYAVRGTIVGSIEDVTGGTPPFAYQLINGNGSNDVDNQCFIIDGESVIISEERLSSKIYYIYLEVVDFNNMSYAKPLSITVHPDPITKEREIRYINGILLGMRYLSPGTFTTYIFKDSDHLKDITLSTGYWMSETEITQELFLSVMGYNPSNYNNTSAPGEMQERRPVENISFIEAIVFCNRLSQLDGKEIVYKSNFIDNWLALPNESIQSLDIETLIEIHTAGGYRIPSEYEWKWASIGGYNSSGYRKYFSGGDIESKDRIDDYVWYVYNSDIITHEVGKKLPNEYGIYDMTGNVWEYLNNGCSIGASAFQLILTETPSSMYYQFENNYPQHRHTPTGIRVVSNR